MSARVTPWHMGEVALYQYEISPFADKVRRALKLKCIEYSVREVRPSKASKFKDISPTGKFPALSWDDHLIVDSTEIIRFLEEQVPEPSLFPAEAKDRALAHILEDWADESLYFYDLAIRSKPHNVGLLVEDINRYETGLAAAIMNRLIPGASRKIGKVQGLGRKADTELARDIERHFSALEDLLDGSEWLVGDSVSIADLAVVSMIHVLIRAQEPAASLPEFTKLSAWKAKLDQMTLA